MKDKRQRVDDSAARPVPGWGPSLWPAAWFMLAAAMSGMAAFSAFDHDAAAALRRGTLALIAVSLGMLLQKLKPGVGRGDPRWVVARYWQRLPDASLSLLGMAAMAFAHAALLAGVTRSHRGVYLWGDLMVWRDDAIAASCALGGAWLVMGLWSCWRWRSGLGTGPSAVRAGAAALGGGLLALLLIPGITLEHAGSHALYAKRSLLAVLRAPWSESTVLVAHRLGEGGPLAGDDVVVCVLRRHRAALLLEWQTPDNRRSPVDAEDASMVQVQRQRCAQEVQTALASGTAIEADLYQGDLPRFFERARQRRAGQQPLAADLSRLPPVLAVELIRLLPESYRWRYSAFDVALASGHSREALALMGDPGRVLPHQRQALFELGLASHLEVATASRAVRSWWDERLSGANALALGLHSDREEQAGPTLAYDMQVGGYAEFDYLMVNRRCDLRFATYLHLNGRQPATAHALHLKALLEPGRRPQGADGMGGTVGLGSPGPMDRAHCRALLRWYDEMLPSEQAHR